MSTKKRQKAPAKCDKACCDKEEALNVLKELGESLGDFQAYPIAYPPVMITREEWKEFFSWLRSIYYEADHFDNISFKNLELTSDVRIYDILRFWVYGIKYKQQ